MFSKTLIFTTTLVCLFPNSWAVPTLLRREVPQEHSHQQFLTSVQTSLLKNNPLDFVDAVFGLLGNEAAAGGLGKLTDVNCLQQAIADQAFTNAKADGDVQGQVDALIYRALEKNTGSVGQTSDPCASIQAVNPEIAAIQQHQDPASTNAASVNKAIVLALAQQINAVGGNPLDALKSGTFAPGNIGDPTGKGNTCDDANDPIGCIFTQNLLVDDASNDEINAAVAGTASNNAASNSGASSNVDTAAASPTTESCAAVTVTVTAAAAPATATTSANSAASSSASSSSSSSSGQNLQTFTGSLGGSLPPPVTAGGKGFETDNSQFVNLAAALGRSCDVQHNACANAANSGKGSGLTVGQCDQQDTACKAAINA